MKGLLMNASPTQAGIVQCYIERNKSGVNKLYPEYTLKMKDGDRFMLCAKKRSGNKTSNYLISMQEGDLRRDSSMFLGKLRANFLGTDFQIFDKGTNPRDIEYDDDTSKMQLRQELGVIIYASNVLGSRGPRKMQVAIPKVDTKTNEREIWRPQGEDEMLGKVKEKDFSNLFYYINKPPKWNEQVGAYVLNFNGRVTMASVKNFQLVAVDNHEDVILQFGRVGKDTFNMDYQHPLSPFQAFAITLSSFDSKLACE